MTDSEKSKEQLIEELTKSRQEEAHWRSVVANTPIFVIVLDRDGTIRYVNRSVSGIPVEVVLGKTTYEFLHPQYHDRVREQLRRVFEAGESAFSEVIGAGPNRQDAWYELSIGPVIIDGQVLAATMMAIDITERKLTENALQENERRLAILLSNLPGMAYRCQNDSLWTMDFISDGCISLTGFPPSAFLGNRKVTFGKIIHPEDRERVWDEVQQAIAEGRRFRLEYRIHTASGEEKWIWEQGTGIYSEGGHLEALEGLMMDITERKRAEEALRQAKDELELRVEERTIDLRKSNQELEIHRLFAQNATQCFGIANLEGIVTYINPAFCRLLGEERIEDVVGQPFFKFGRTTEYVENHFLPLLMKEGHWDNEGLIRTRQGNLVPIWNSSFIIQKEDGGPAYIATIITDIKERKQTENALRKSEERFRSYFEQGLLGMSISDREMRWIEVNDSFCDILGYSKEEVLQQKITDFVHPDDLEAFLQSFRQILSGGTDHYTVDRRYLRKDGKVVYLNIFVRVFHSADGTADHFLALFDDVTERRRAEEALRQSHDELRTIYEGMVDGCVLFDTKALRTVQANARLCEMLGYDEEEIKALMPEQKHPAEFLPRMNKFYQATLSSRESFLANVPVFHKTGRILYFDLAVRNISYNGRHCQLLFFHNVSERHQAQEALQRERRTLKHLLKSSDQERQTIAYEIHDGLAQYLAAAIMQFDVDKSQREKKPKEAAKAYEAAMTLLHQGHSEARRLIAGIRHPVLDEAGVVEAVAHLINEQNRKKGPQIEFRSLVSFSRLIPLLENAIYRIIQEAMNNAGKYSQSDRVRITLLQQKDWLRIEVRDWGIGFNTKEVKEGSYGLIGIRERVRLLGGKYQIRSMAGKGTRIVVELPLMEREDEEV